MQCSGSKNFFGLCLIVLLTALSFTSQVRSYVTLPTQQKVPVGEQVKLDLDFPQQILERLSVYAKTETSGILEANGSMVREKVFSFNKDWPVAVQPGKVDLKLMLFGIIPLRQVTVDVVPLVKVYPAGQSIGVMLQSQGVTVVGYSPVSGQDGQQFFPAKEAGIQLGDKIVSINGVTVTNDSEAAKLINKAGSTNLPIKMVLERSQSELEVTIQPRYCEETQRYRIGLFIKDSAAGVGSLTFYEADQKVYGALGHIITDGQTDQQIELGHGNIVSAAIHGIQQGKRGRPGEKIGIFQQEGIKGNIDKNTMVGIFGKLDALPQNGWFDKPVPVAYVDEIEPGPAKIYTVVDGNKVEEFTIEIERIIPQRQVDGKGLVIRITDGKLLSLTGGIIQGMSGSPIVQNGKLVGAVTHVFVNDPTRGYGVPAEWMLRETSLLQPKTRRQVTWTPGFSVRKIASARDNLPKMVEFKLICKI